jgi:hypothetical protein
LGILEQRVSLLCSLLSVLCFSWYTWLDLSKELLLILQLHNKLLFYFWPGEKLWADKGYPDSQYFISLYKSKVTLQQHKSNKAIYRVRQIVERSILQMKQFAHVTHQWPYSWRLHQQCMIAQAKLVNFTLKKHPFDFNK